MNRSIGIAAGMVTGILALASSSFASAAEITIAYSSPNTGNNYHISFQCGIVKAAKDLNVKLLVSGASVFSPSTQIPVINAVGAIHPDALITAPTDVTALIQPLQQIKDAGTKIIIYDTGLKDGTIASATVTADNEGGGVAAAQQLVKIMGATGKVLIIDIAAGVASTNARASGVIEELSKHPGIKILPTQYDNESPVKDAQIADATLAANPDLTGIIPVYNDAATGVVTALKANGRIGKIPVITFDADPAIVQAVKDGSVAAVVNQTPFAQARIAIEDAIKAVKGEKIDPTLVRMPMPVVTKDNIDDPKITQEFYVDKLCNP